MEDNMDDFVKDMEEDILDDDQLNDMIPDTPPPPRQVMQRAPVKKNIYQEQIKKPNKPMNQPKRQPMRQSNQEYDEMPEPKQSTVNKLKQMINLNALKLPILVFVLYIILSLPKISELLGTYVPVLKPGIISTIAKGVFFALIVLVMNKLFKS
jgi:hypothetical protein